MSKIKHEQVRVGGFYVNETKGLVRELVSSMENGDVCWLSYSLRSGESWGDSGLCSKYNITQWATREATEEEVADLGRNKAQSDHLAREVELAQIFLKSVSDATLLAEVNRRGLSVAPQKQ